MENSQISSTQTQSVVGAFMTKVYSWMTLALFITGIVAMYVASSEQLLSIVFGRKTIFHRFFILQKMVISFTIFYK